MMLTKKDSKLSHILGLLDTEGIDETANAFYDLGWMVGINQTDTLLFTSDAPIVPIPYKNNGARGNRGLRSDGIEVIFPLTPRMVLVMFDPIFHIERESFNMKYVRTRDSGLIGLYNKNMMEWAERCVFSQDGNFEICRTPGFA